MKKNKIRYIFSIIGLMYCKVKIIIFYKIDISYYQAKLTPAEVSAMLRGNEYSISDLPPGPIKSFETNTLRSNNPTEDSHSEAIVSYGEGYLFGIYDGHGGAACGQAR